MTRPSPASATSRRATWVALTCAALATLAGCAEPPPPPPPPVIVEVPPPPPERRMLLTIDFRLGSWRIQPGARPLLDNLAAALQDPRLAGARFELNGHTDISGSFAWNVALSFLRASAVAGELAKRGVPPTSITAQGFGPLQLLYPDQPRAAGNRRVEIVAIGP